MEVVIRKYAGTGAKELFEHLAKHTADIERLLRSVKGFVSYTLASHVGGGVSITVCEDQAGIDESTQKAREWVAHNAAHIHSNSPEVSVGKVILHLK